MFERRGGGGRNDEEEKDGEEGERKQEEEKRWRERIGSEEGHVESEREINVVEGAGRRREIGWGRVVSELFRSFRSLA